VLHLLKGVVKKVKKMEKKKSLKRIGKKPTLSLAQMKKELCYLMSQTGIDSILYIESHLNGLD
jgi:hypothetical protein